MPRALVDGLWPDDEQIDTTRDGAHFRMTSGREYVVSSSLLASNPQILRTSVIPFTRYIDEHPEENPIIFTTFNVPQLLSRPPIPFSERVRLLARAVVREIGNRPGRLRISLSPHIALTNNLMRASYVSSPEEVSSILDYWENEGVIEQQKFLGSATDVSLTVRGLIALEEDIALSESDTAFIAMWFSPDLAEAYDNGIAPAVEELGYRPVRIDRREHNNKIDDEIIAEIRRARFLVADFSCGADGARGGVYYEAGFAAGLGKPVIHMVRDDDKNLLHFDTRRINHIIWHNPSDLKEKLRNRIGATLGSYR